jgi:hypothetical protein
MWKEEIMEYLHFIEGAEVNFKKTSVRASEIQSNKNSVLDSCSMEVI